MTHKLVFAVAAILLSTTPANAEPDAFTGTAANMTSPELDAAAKRGAVVLWALGAIEQHGPHLPLATDVYIPQAQLARAAEKLRAGGVEPIVLPPYYWGVNQVTGAFPGSINIRPETMEAVMGDVFASLKAAGVREVYCITGHWDAAHGRTIAKAVAAADEAGFRVRFVAPKPLADRLGLTGPSVLRADLPSFPTPFPDVHAGDDETSVMLAVRPDTVRLAIAKRLRPTTLGPEQFKAWRTGGEVTKRITPDGYVGDPAKADAARGSERAEANASAIAEAIFLARRAAAPAAINASVPSER